MTDFGALAHAMESGRISDALTMAGPLFSGQIDSGISSFDRQEIKVELGRWLGEKGQTREAIRVLLSAIDDARADPAFDIALLARLLDEVADLLMADGQFSAAGDRLYEAQVLTGDIEDAGSKMRLARLARCMDAYQRAGNAQAAAKVGAEIGRAQDAVRARGKADAANLGNSRRAEFQLFPINDGKTFDVVRVHFGTHRKPRGRKDAYDAFTGEADARMHYGWADVSVPRDREVGSLPTPGWRTERFANRARYFVIDDWGLTSSKAEFVGDLRKEIGASDAKEMLIFIHGYRNSFHSAIIQTAQLAADLKINGSCVSYCWPSRDSTLSYFMDRNQVLRSYINELRDLIHAAARESGAQRVYIIAHSLGSLFMLEGLEALMRTAGLSREALFNEIVFASPDVDALDFKTRAPNIAPLGRRVTVYSSESDRALTISEKLWGRVRAGRQAEAICTPGLQCIDTTLAKGSFIGHSDYAETAIDDLRAVIWFGAEPKRRMLQPTGTFWRYEPERGNDHLDRHWRKALHLVRTLGPADAQKKVRELMKPPGGTPSHDVLRQIGHWNEVNRHIERLFGP